MPRLSFLSRSKLLPLAALVVAASLLAACDKRQQFSTIFGPRQAEPPAGVPGPVPPQAEPSITQPSQDPAAPGPLPGRPEAAEIANVDPNDTRFTPPVVPRLTTDVPRVAILLPLSGPSAPIGNALLNAAQLALFHFAETNFELLPHDTRGTPEGAAQAARFAIDDGANLILGPLFNHEVEAVAPAARAAGISVIAFTSDKRVARDGVYVMGFRPDEQVERVVRYAFGRGVRRFAFLGPDNPFGRAISDAMQATIARLPGAALSRVEIYNPNTEDFGPLVRRLADYDSRRANLLAQKEELAGREDEVAKAALKRLDTLQTLGDLPFEALLIADGGKRLEAIAALLPYYDIDPKRTRILGTGLWDTPGIGKEPALLGAWYAAPSPSARATFEQQYAEIYGARPARLATLAYDATAIAALFAPTQGRIEETTLTSPQGFAGRDGVFRFLPDGVTERGLSVHQVNVNGANEISAAPATFEPTTN